VDPITIASRGVPVTVTVSDIFAVNEIELPGTYVAFAGALTDVMVGAVRSITIVLADAIELGPVVVDPVTEFAFN
jgi:hypothetical protein